MFPLFVAGSYTNSSITTVEFGPISSDDWSRNRICACPSVVVITRSRNWMSLPTVNWRASAPGGVPAADGFTALVTPTRGESAAAANDANTMPAAKTAILRRDLFMAIPCKSVAAFARACGNKQSRYSSSDAGLCPKFSQKINNSTELTLRLVLALLAIDSSRESQPAHRAHKVVSKTRRAKHERTLQPPRVTQASARPYRLPMKMPDAA
jgi:hypothetical protein